MSHPLEAQQTRPQTPLHHRSLADRARETACGVAVLVACIVARPWVACEPGGTARRRD